MKIAITDYYGFKEHYKIRLERIKSNNFTAVMMSNDVKYKKTNGSLRKRVKYAKKIGLELASLHASYDDNLEFFNLEGKIGNKIEKLLKKEIILAHKYGFSNLVVHIEGNPSKTLLERISRLLKVCEKYNVNFALENLSDVGVFEFIQKNIKNKHLTFCYDSGHANVFCKNKKFFPEFANILSCVHLHDNNGLQDQHMPFDFGGTIDVQKLAKNLAGTSLNSLDFEIIKKPNNMTPDELLTKVYKNAIIISELIENFRREK